MNEKEKEMTRLNFSRDGFIYVVGGGNTYNIKEELKQKGFWFSSEYGWFRKEEIDLPAPYKLFKIAFDELYKWEPQFNKAFPRDNIKQTINSIIYNNNEKKNSLSTYVGTLGERITVPVIFKRVKNFNGFYIYTFKYEHNVLIWVTKKQTAFQVNQPLELTGTVRAHEEVHGIQITKVNRCSIKIS